MIGLKRKRRLQLMEKPLPPPWLAWVQRNVPYFACLSEKNRSRLQGLVQVFLAEKHFEGCGGLEITDEMRVTIAAQACILLLGLENDFYPKLQSILVYPHAYVATHRERLPDGSVIEALQERLGETWSQGSLVLAWDEVKRGTADIHDGHNVVFHEFAHQLDYESGAAEGTPRLPNRSRYITWARVLGGEYEALLKDLALHRRTLLDSYGATNPAEFFAVVTEFFFEKPAQLKKHHPALYDQLTLFYNQDPSVNPVSCEERGGG
jgi:Mlc titration factor MtfA (ptsG expression regulator)